MKPMMRQLGFMKRPDRDFLMALIPTAWSRRWRSTLRLLAAALLLAVSIRCTAFAVDASLEPGQNANAPLDAADCATCAAQCERRLFSAKREIARLRTKLRLLPRISGSSSAHRPTRLGPGRKRSRIKDFEVNTAKETGTVAAEIWTASVGPRRALQQQSGSNLIPPAPLLPHTHTNTHTHTHTNAHHHHHHHRHRHRHARARTRTASALFTHTRTTKVGPRHP